MDDVRLVRPGVGMPRTRRRLALAFGALAVGCDRPVVESTLPTRAVAPFAEPSVDKCPLLEQSQVITMGSGGDTRRAHVFLPEDRSEPLPVLFAWHGLGLPGSSNPAKQMIENYELNELADGLGTVVVVPEASVQVLPRQGEVAMWRIFQDAEPDLQFYDDLRTCLSRRLDIDATRIASWGHSVGALWASVLLMERSDTFSAVATISGGIEIDLPVLGPQILWKTPKSDVPTLVVSGGDRDVWPHDDPLIHFEYASDRFAAKLLEDGHVVGRCTHDEGHYALPSAHWDTMLQWLSMHIYGASSPWARGEILPPWRCSVQVPDARRG